MQETTNLKLKKPVLNETADIEVINDNMDIIDQEIENNKSQLKDIATDNSRLTTDKTVTGAINELFTNVSNGKGLISTAITDVDENVIVPSNPTFSQLSAAISEINTGKKWASGTNISDSNYEVSVSGLDFTPSLVLVTYHSDEDEKTFSVRMNNSMVGGTSGTYTYAYLNNGNWDYEEGSPSFFEGGFVLPVGTHTTYDGWIAIE